VDERRARYPGWRVAAASAVGVFVSFASLLVYTFGIFLKPISEEFGWPREAVSAAFGIAAMTVAACSPGLGYLLDHYPARRIVVPCLIVFGIAFASLARLTSSIWHLYATFVVLGIVGNGTAQMAYSRTVAGWFDRRRGLALAIVMAGGAIGAMVLPPVAAQLIAQLGWRGAAAVLGTLVLVLGLPAVIGFVREPPPRPAADRACATDTGVADALRSRVFWIVVTVLFCASIAQNGAIAHLAALLTDRGVSAAGAALAVSAMGAAGLVGRLVTGVLLDRYRVSGVWFGLLAIAGAGTLLLARADSLPTGLVAASLIGLGMGGEADVTPYVLSRYFGFRAFSMLYGLTWTFYAVAGAIGPVLMGRAFDLTGSYATLLGQLAVVTFVVALVPLLLPRGEAAAVGIAAATSTT
jgi:MFS family permease